MSFNVHLECTLGIICNSKVQNWDAIGKQSLNRMSMCRILIDKPFNDYLLDT